MLLFHHPFLQGSLRAVVSVACRDLFFFQAEDGIRDLVRSRGLGDVYKRQVHRRAPVLSAPAFSCLRTWEISTAGSIIVPLISPCLLYTSDAADDLLCVDLGGRRIIKKKNNSTNITT